MSFEELLGSACKYHHSKVRHPERPGLLPWICSIDFLIVAFSISASSTLQPAVFVRGGVVDVGRGRTRRATQRGIDGRFGGWRKEGEERGSG
jgi:hypothetical protein